MAERKKILLRLDPAVHDALARWASDELRSTNAQIEHLLRAALADRGRLPRDVSALPRRGRPPRMPATHPEAGDRAAEGNQDAEHERNAEQDRAAEQEPPDHI
ncbi:hypothetical protein Ga0074812_12737 [Parafrankia irregularis]|uniref:HicB family protein n=1 Tax=Parafrankia irregularis TaxID=795642 RepID=A0A0S4QUT1_9ACTN|nr:MULTISPECIES: hypothetical protein [Parafrankia]MBE3201565.1 hypothetical protein [Parafrankia sp. CH37]CUU59360.1 hypothetical protein Ga0074812_12737 [Parafrankia irregularis]